MSTVRLFLRQGLSLRGHTDAESNLTQLLVLRAEDAPELKGWVAAKRYTSPEMVNELINRMGQAVLRNTLASIHEAAYYSILADETRDLSNLEQLTICIRWVDDHYSIHEDFSGLMKLRNITAHVILTALKDVLVMCNLSLARCPRTRI